MIKEREPTASAALVLDLFDGLDAYNLINSDDLKRLKIKREQFMDVEQRFPVTLIHELWQCAREKNPPSNIGLCIGCNVNPVAKGILAHLISQSDNLKDALDLFHDKSALMSEAEKIHYTEKNNQLKIKYQFLNPDHHHKYAIERSLSIALTWCRHLTGNPCIPIKCGFRHSQTEYLAEYIKMFGPNVLFNQSEDYLLFDASLLKLPLKNTNPYLKAILLKQAQRIESRLYEKPLLSARVSEIIEKNLSSQTVNIHSVSRELNMSRQTLHRKLKAEKTHFTHLLTQIRKEKALHFLNKTNLQMDMISEQLGFEEPSAFFKAFKGWFNTTPKNYKNTSLTQPQPTDH